MSSLGSMLELVFMQQLKDARLAEHVEREYAFAAPERKWRFDFSWLPAGIAVEIEGGTWVGGKHVNPARFEGETEKYNEATLRGWRVFRFTSDQVNDGRAIAFMRRVFARETGERFVGSS